MAHAGQGERKNESVDNSSSHTVNEPTVRHLHKGTYSIATQKQTLTHTHAAGTRAQEEKSDKAKDDGDYDT